MILVEMVHDARIVRMNEAHAPEEIRLWLGDSVGHWDGDTRVVETTHYQGMSGYRPTSPALRVTERFTRVAPDVLEHELTFDDPETWVHPWTIIVPLEYSPDPIFEYACHEGNIGMEGILSGHRAEERSAGK